MFLFLSFRGYCGQKTHPNCFVHFLLCSAINPPTEFSIQQKDMAVSHSSLKHMVTVLESASWRAINYNWPLVMNKAGEA